jgi:PAS domain S-box-containing protein
VDRHFPEPREQPLATAGYTLRIPLERVGTIHGLLYLGLRRGIYPLGAEGQEVVSAFAAQAAVALESSRYLDDLRRQAEEYRILHANTQRIIESSAAAILVCDASGRILSANTEAAGIFSHDAQELVGRALKTLVYRPEGWLTHLPLHAANAEATTRSDPPRRLIMAVSVLELETGTFNGRVVVLQDVTELRQLQDRMREQDRLASLGRLASGLAHEINTPLTGIASFAQMLGEMTPEQDPRAALVSKLVDQSFRVSRIVANLHEAVRGSRESRRSLEIGGVASRAAMDAARSLGAGDRLVLEGVVEPVMVLAAAGPVELAVSNLVRNAIEASPAGGRVTMRLSCDSEWAEIEVRDDGPGVPEEVMSRVFEPFFSTKTERGGTGLGLAITRDMIGQLGGEVRLENIPDGGARATIRLQRCQESAASS